MTVVDTMSDAGAEFAVQRRTAARNMYRASLAEGLPLSGAELGRRFGLSPRWGRQRVAEAHAEASASGNGSRPATDRAPEKQLDETDGGAFSSLMGAVPGKARIARDLRY